MNVRTGGMLLIGYITTIVAAKPDDDEDERDVTEEYEEPSCGMPCAWYPDCPCGDYGRVWDEEDE